MENWTDSSREDLNMIPTMEQNGFTADIHWRDRMHKRTTPQNVPQDAVSFKKGNVHVWQSPYGGKMHWRVAELVLGFYCNHRSYDTLNEVLEKEKF